MSVFHLSHRLLLMGSLAAALGAGAVQGSIPKPIPVTPGANAGEITANLTLNKLTNDSAWELRGYTLVKAGVTLTIEPGTTIQSHPTDKGVLMVDRGGYLIAAGTAEAPITFKGATDERGKWGGLVLLGKAFSNQNSGGSDVQYEALEWAAYSGSDDNDSSGVLTYLRLINPGFPISVDRELNGLTLCAVGRRTVIHHIQVHRGDDDGVEWFGGTVNTSHLVVTNAVDDSYDTDHGYNGNSQYMIAIQSAEPPRPRENPALPKEGETVGDRGLECGSHPAGHNKYTNPVWKNITFIDNGRSGGAFEAKEECGGSYQNMVLVSGGITVDTSAWAMSFSSPKTVSGIVAPTPHIDFKKTYLTGKYKNKYEIISNNPDQIANATRILNLKIKALPFDEINSYGLYSDLSASNAQIAADSAGAIVGNDLWYKGWTIDGTVGFPKGDAPALPNAGAPTVTLVPDPATLPYAPANFTLNANAADPDGISKLEILKDGIAVASSQTASVSYNVTGAAKGSHAYTVRATDNHAANKMTTTQDFGFLVPFKPNSAAPSVTFTRSTGDAALVAPAALTLNVGAIDADGIDSLQILKDEVVLKTVTGEESLSLDLSGLGEGDHAYFVRAKDAHSDDPKITLKQLVVQVKANKAPVIDFTPPGDLTAPAAFTLTATANDSDGAIASMQILEGTTVLKTVAGGAVSLSLTDKPAATYTYTVKATDNNPVDPITVTMNFTVIVSEPATVENESAPTIILARGDDKPLVAPASFKLFANAGDPHGIDTLEVLLNGVVVKTGTAGSLEIPITITTAGTYTYTARAKDKHATDPKEATQELEVVVEAPAPNAADPTLTLTHTAFGTLSAPASFSVFAQASDADGIDSVEIFQDGVRIGWIAGGALLVPVEDLPAGTYTFTARAKDKHASSGITTKVLIIEVSNTTALAKPLRDLSGLSAFSARGQDLLVRSEGHGKVHLTVMSLSGRRVASRSVNLLQGQNSIPMGNLRGVHVVLVSNGKKARTTRVVFSAGR